MAAELNKEKGSRIIHVPVCVSCAAEFEAGVRDRRSVDPEALRRTDGVDGRLRRVRWLRREDAVDLRAECEGGRTPGETGTVYNKVWTGSLGPGLLSLIDAL
jgi:hypothetical protein